MGISYFQVPYKRTLNIEKEISNILVRPKNPLFSDLHGYLVTSRKGLSCREKVTQRRFFLSILGTVITTKARVLV